MHSVASVACVDGVETRAAALRQRIERDPASAVDALHELVVRAAHGDGGARDVLLAFAYLRARGDLDPRALEELALARGRALAAPLFRTDSPRASPRREPSAGAFAYRRLRLPAVFPASRGRVATATIRERVLVDPRPEVVARALAEAPLELRDVLRIASRRPAPPGVLVAVARDARWIRRHEVREALVANPFTPTWLALVLLPAVRAHARASEGRRSPELRAYAQAIRASTAPSAGS